MLDLGLGGGVFWTSSLFAGMSAWQLARVSCLEIQGRRWAREDPEAFETARERSLEATGKADRDVA
jgi:hypothetical protein